MVSINFSLKTPGARCLTGACEKPLQHVHSCHKHHHEEVASSKKNEFKTKVQKSIPYLLPKWQQNG